jgi:hypothetical protein
MIARNTFPIVQVKPDLTDSLRMAVAEIERFLALFYPADTLRQTESAKAVAGQWLSRVKGFHNDDGFLHLTRDFLAYTLSGGARSGISDQLGYYFSGFMPSYGMARIFMSLLSDGATWNDVRAFMHSQGYGNAREYIESFDWTSARQKADAEIEAWTKILRAEDAKLQAASHGAPVLLAQALPAPNAPVTDVPMNDPYFPKPKPELRILPGGQPIEGPAEAVGERVAQRLAPVLLRAGSIALFTIIIVVTPGNVFEKNDEDEYMRRLHAEYERKQQVPIPDVQSESKAQTDAANNECKAQIEQNQKNGAVCENDGYVLMEDAMKYKRLVNPPKGRGLDGLFEKNEPFNQPMPMPESVDRPKPGKLVFIPDAKRPPKPDYDFVNAMPGKSAFATYPFFVVFEAKNVSKQIDSNNVEALKKEVKSRLHNTCDGRQMSEPWTETRIPQALARKDSGLAKDQQDLKIEEISTKQYARWLFACLPGPVGAPFAKVYTFIDVVASEMDLESMPPKPRKVPGGNRI